MSKRILIACPECYTQFGFESPQTTAQAEQIVALETENTRLKQQLKDTRDELSAYRLASERAIYDAQQFDASLFLAGDRGVEDVLRRVLARLGEYEGVNRRWHSFETVQALTTERDQLRDELAVARETKLLAWTDGLTANLGIMRDEFDKVLCMFLKANKAKRENLVNWQSAAAENRRLVGMEQDAQHYKEEMEEAQADARALAEAANAVLEELDIIRKAQGNFLRVHSITHQELRDALSHHGAKYLEAQP